MFFTGTQTGDLRLVGVVVVAVAAAAAAAAVAVVDVHSSGKKNNKVEDCHYLHVMSVKVSRSKHDLPAYATKSKTKICRIRVFFIACNF